MQCPVCKARQPDDARICSFCEEPLTPGAGASAGESATVSSALVSDDAVPGSGGRVLLFFGALLLLLFLSVGAVLWQLFGRGEVGVSSAPVTGQPQATVVPVVAESRGRTTTEVKSSGDPVKEVTPEHRDESRLPAAPALPAGAPQGAGALALATVTIETPWGPASGFLVDDRHLITATIAIKVTEMKKRWAQEGLARAEKWVAGQRQRLYFLEKRRDPEAVTARTRLNKGIENAGLWRRLTVKLDNGLQPEDYTVRLADGSRRTVTALVHGSNYPLTMVNFSGAPLTAFAAERSRLAVDCKSEEQPGGVVFHRRSRIYTLGKRGAQLEIVNGEWVGWFVSRTESNASGRSYLKVAIDPPHAFLGGPMIEEKSAKVVGINTLCREVDSGSHFCYAAPLAQIYSEFKINTE